MTIVRFRMFLRISRTVSQITWLISKMNKLERIPRFDGQEGSLVLRLLAHFMSK